MKPPVVLFKKESMKFYLFLKAKSQPKAYQHSWYKRKDAKKNFNNKIGESFLLLICLMFFDQE